MASKRNGLSKVTRLNPGHLDKKALADRIGVSTKTIENMLKRKELPKPIRYSKKHIRWSVGDIEAWENAKKQN